MSNTVKRRLAQNELDDLVMLDKATEERIIEVLKNRHSKDLIYTNIGPVLVAINPFKTIPSLYTEARIREYQSKKYFEVPPHPYAVIEEAYSNMNTYRQNQCIIISGESGAGKTETAKIIMQYVSSVSGKGSDLERVKNRLLSSNPILEGFGNAKTINNNNSSRFGKYMVLHFNYAGEAIGGHVNNYLLEKSRVVGPAPDERNFHVFYQITKGVSADIKAKLYIESPDYYRYLSCSECLDVQGIDDVADWKEMQEAFATIGITEEEKFEIIRTISIILWLGNLDFEQDEKEAAYISEQAVIDIIAHLMQVPVQDVIDGLCIRTITAGGIRGEVYKKPCNKEEAEFNRDTLAKAMYSKLFDYLVSRINESIYTPTEEGGCHIGILDIFGFEIFENNSFEQLCINFVNEKLQNIFIELTLKSEQEEYVQEGIQWNPVKYVDNKPVCDLIEGRPGLLSLLDDSCSTNKDDAAFVTTLNSQFSQNEHLQTSTDTFTVQHYAGNVKYNMYGFIVKNKDTLFDDLIICLQKSPCGFVKYHGWADINTSQSQKQRPPTVGKVFKEHVTSLVKSLTACQPHYIRCVKPNHNKQPGRFDAPMITRQCRYLGLLENVRVRRAGYAYRSTFEKFGQRYGIVSDQLVNNNNNFTDPKQRVELVIKELNWEHGKQYVLGKTKIFIREAAVLFTLEEILERKISSTILVLQNAYRSYLHKRKYFEVTACAYDVMKEANKERRRHSISSNIAYRGDYINAHNCIPIKQIISQYNVTNNLAMASTGVTEDIIFADKVSVVNLKEKQGLFGSLFSKKDSLLESRLFIATNQAVYLYTLIPDPEKKSQTIVKLYWRVEFNAIKHITVSPYQDGYLLFTFADDLNIKDTLLCVTRKSELLASIRHGYEYPSLLGPTSKVTIKVSTQESVLVNVKKQKSINIRWVRDTTNMPEDSTIIKDKETKEDIIITVAKGVTMNEVPEPYRPPKIDFSAGGRIAMKAIQSASGNGVDELTVRQGDIVYIIRDDDKGWVQCETPAGLVGWINKSLLEYLDPTMNNINKKPPPPKPTTGLARPAPPAAPQRNANPQQPNRNAAFGAVLNQWSQNQ